MKEVTFYTHVANREDFLCRLAQTALRNKTKLLILLDDIEDIDVISKKLWQQENSFLAHHLWFSGTPIPIHSPIILTSYFDEDELLSLPKTLLNFKQEFNIYPYFSRVLEIVGEDETALQHARERFTVYKNQGYQLTHHRM